MADSFRTSDRMDLSSNNNKRRRMETSGPMYGGYDKDILAGNGWTSYRPCQCCDKMMQYDKDSLDYRPCHDCGRRYVCKECMEPCGCSGGTCTLHQCRICRHYQKPDTWKIDHLEKDLSSANRTVREIWEDIKKCQTDMNGLFLELSRAERRRDGIGRDLTAAEQWQFKMPVPRYDEDSGTWYRDRSPLPSAPSNVHNATSGYDSDYTFD